MQTRARGKTFPRQRIRPWFLREVQGVGPVTSATLLAELPELGELEHKQIGAHAVVRERPVLLNHS